MGIERCECPVCDLHRQLFAMREHADRAAEAELIAEHERKRADDQIRRKREAHRILTAENKRLRRERDQWRRDYELLRDVGEWSHARSAPKHPQDETGG